MELAIDKEFQKLLWPLASEEFEQLEASLSAEGCRDSLVVWRPSSWVPDGEAKTLLWDSPTTHDRTPEGDEYRVWEIEDGDEYWSSDWPRIIVDGHNRYEICTRLGIGFDVVEMEFANKEAAADWIDRNQAGRRNATPEQLRLIRGRIYNRRKKAHGGDRAGDASAQIEPLKTADKLAEQFKVSPATIKRDGQLAEAVEALDLTADYTKGEVKASAAEILDAAKPVVEANKARKQWEKEREEKPFAPPPEPDPVKPESIEEIKQKLKKPHVARNTGDNEWYTPPVFIEAAKAVLGNIDLDPASSEIANKTVGATTIYTEEDDGLSKDWPVGNIWMNPPYAQPAINRFCSRIVEEVLRGSQAIVLVNNGTETQWFQNMAAECAAVCFPKSRVRFLDPEGNPGAPLQGQAVVYFGSTPDLFKEHFQQFGEVFYHG